MMTNCDVWEEEWDGKSLRLSSDVRLPRYYWIPWMHQGTLITVYLFSKGKHSENWEKEQRRKTRMLAKFFSTAMASSWSFGVLISSINPVTISSKPGVQMGWVWVGKLKYWKNKKSITSDTSSPKCCTVSTCCQRKFIEGLSSFQSEKQGRKWHNALREKWIHIGEFLYGNWQPSERSDVILVFCSKIGGFIFWISDGFVGGEGLIFEVCNLVDNFLNNIIMRERGIDDGCHVCDVQVRRWEGSCVVGQWRKHLLEFYKVGLLTHTNYLYFSGCDAGE